MVRVRIGQANGKECKKVLIAVLFKALTPLAKTSPVSTSNSSLFPL